MSEYINKEQAIDLIESMIADKGVAFNPHKLAMALKDMESVEIPEAKDTDLISRQAAIEAVEKAVFKGVAKSAIESLPPVEPKPVCEDAISRADTIKAMCADCEAFFGDDANCADCYNVEERYENLLLKIAVASSLIDEVYEAGKLYERHEYSIQHISNRANQYLTELRDMLCEISYLPPIEPIEESEDE